MSVSPVPSDEPPAASGERSVAGAGGRVEDDPISVRRSLATALLRAGTVEPEALSRAERLLAKLDGDGTLLKVLSSTSGLTREALLDAVRTQRPDLPIGALLVQLGLVDPGHLRQVLQLQAKGGHQQRIGELLVAKRVLRETELTSALASQLGYESEEPDIGTCDAALLANVPLKTLQRFGFLPLRREDENRVVVAFVDPTDQNARTEAARTVSAVIRPVMTSNVTLVQALAAIARRRGRGGDAANDELGAPNALVARMLTEAIAAGASDVHVEPLKDRVRVRVRVDGTLTDLLEFPSSMLDALVSRLKIMAEADIAERRRHQDGHIEFEHPSTGALTDLRASFYVTVHGECVVLRVLNQANRIIELDEIGMSPGVLRHFRSEALESPSGVVIVTGPTGSGKTSTLYSCVHQLNDDRTSIVTVEDPVEYRLDGISQCSVNPKIGRTFDESLRHVVRQDPDVIVIGEIRDAASAENAIQAALTGHKVLTTFHTEDAVGALLRLVNMDIESFLIASTVSCVIAQRLVRRVCDDCALDMEPDPADIRGVGWKLEQAAGGRFRSGVGCERCHFTGYRGRMGVFEALVMNEPVREAVLERRTSTQLRRISLETAGLVTLLEDGLVKAARGETTLAEVRRTLPRLHPPRPLQEIRRLSGLR